MFTAIYHVIPSAPQAGATVDRHMRR